MFEISCKKLSRACKHGLPNHIESPAARLVKIMHNFYIAVVRRRGYRCTSPLGDSHDEVSIFNGDCKVPAWSHATVRDVHSAFNKIELSFREAYILRTFEYLSYKAL